MASPDAAAGGPGWDPLVRITHWGIAAAVLVNGIVTDGGSRLHVWIGYAAFALFALRLLWGVLGPREARFSSFPPSLAAARAHIADTIAGRRRSHPSHNPAGALMVYAVWGTLAVVTATGIGMAPSPFGDAQDREIVRQAGGHDGHEREDEDEDEDEHDHKEGGDDVLEEIHESAANLLIVLAALHVAGVGFETLVTGPSLVRSMVTGERRDAGRG